MTRALSTLVLFLAFAAQAFAATTLADDLGTLINNSPLSRRAAIGVQVIDAESGDVLFERNPEMMFVPASNMKLYTSACALETYGADHRFTTSVALAGDMSGGQVDGDIVLIGGGDPTLRNADLQSLAQRVRGELGISAIGGDVVVDASLFEPRLKGPGWMWDDDPDAYNMSIAAIMLDYNVLEVAVTPGANPLAHLTLASDYPPIEFVTSGPAVTRRPFTDPILVNTTAAADSAQLTMHDPARWIGGVFAEMLASAGIQVPGQVRVVTERASREAALTFEGLPLSEQLALFNKPSENAIGEMLINDLAVNAGRVPASWRAGAEVIGQWLRSPVGLGEGDVNVADGSGLSRYNLICASGTCRLLRHMWQRPDRDVYVNSMPIAGVDGSLRGRMGNTPAQGNVRAKTGTMSGVSCLSGYATTAGGRAVIFSFLMNGLQGSGPARDLQDALCVAIASSR